MEPCRICLEAENVEKLESSLHTIFTICLGLNLENNETSTLCSVCKSKLLEFYEFRQLAHTNSEFFLTKIKLESESYASFAQADHNHDDTFTVAVPATVVKEETETSYDNSVTCFEDDITANNNEFDTEEDTKLEIAKKPTTVKSKVKPLKKRGKYRKKPKGLIEPVQYPDDAPRCPNCLEFFETEKQIWRHMKTHEIEAGGLVCDFCSKVFNNSQTPNRKLLLLHLKKVHLRDPNERFECDICMAQFTQIGSVRVHKKFVHERQPGNFICHVCSKAFRDKFKLSNHVRFKHDKIITHYCPECRKGYGNNTSLKNHIISMHSVEKLFACQYCGKKFSSSSNKITHESKC